MKSNLLLFLAFICFLACNTAPAEDQASSETEAVPANQQVKNSAVRDTFDCELYGKADKKQAIWLAEKELYIRMSGDEFSQDNTTADNINVLQIYDTKNCNLMYNGKLPLVKGTKRPYKLQTDLYEPINQIICTQGVDYAFCYHLDNRQFLVPMNVAASGKVLNKISPDAPRDLAVYGRHLFGWTEGLGTYAFSLADISNPSNEMPVTSFSDGKMTSNLFLIDVKGGKQAVIPTVKNNQLTIEPVFKKAMSVGRRVVRAGTSGRFAILRSNTGNKPIIVDVQKKEVHQLPSNVDPSTITVKKYLNTL